MLIIRILVAMAVTYILSTMMAGITVESWSVAFIFAVVLTLINVTVGRLVKFLGCFIQLLTFGLFGLFVNVAIIQFVANNVDGIYIESWGSALILSIAISLVSWITLDDDSNNQRR